MCNFVGCRGRVMKKPQLWIGVLVGMVLAALVGLFAVPASGIVRMTSMGQTDLLDWWGQTCWESSLRWRASDASIPASADSAEGFEHYASTCLQCHGAPGIGPVAWSQHMRPRPPELWENSTQEMTDGQLFYVIRNGVRMTGMPAFGEDHEDADIWNIVAFVRQLPNPSPAQQKRLQEAAQQYSHHEHSEHSAGNGQHAAPEQAASEHLEVSGAK
jgi:mono/diheme cytochrome c family protein